MIKSYCETFGWFWRQHPALLYGICILVGFSVSLQWHWSLLFPLMAIWAPLLLSLFFNKSQNNEPIALRLLLGLLLSVSALTYSQIHYQFPSLSKEGLEGVGYFEIKSASRVQNHYGNTFKYAGNLRTFEANGQNIARNLPCTIFIKEEYARPPANVSYLIQGRLFEREPKNFILKINAYDDWIPLKHTWSFAEKRYSTKKFLGDFIHKNIPKSKCAGFLTGICTGEFNDQSLISDFSRLGLQHIMAISGFHFAIIAGIFCIILRLFLSPKNAAIFLIILLTGYFAFIGWSPSVQRAWAAVLVFFGGYLFEKNGSSLNSLGIALIVVCITNPLNTIHLGFLFSFLSTASILLFYRGTNHFLQKIFIKRPLKEVVQMDWINQHGYLLLCFYRQAIALTLAVHITAIPMMLYFFHKFPLLSLFYNLFFPFLVTFSMLLLVIGLIVGIIFPFLGQMLHSINSVYTELILKLTAGVPIGLDFNLRAHSFPLELFMGYFCLICIAGIFLQRFLKEKALESHNLIL